MAMDLGKISATVEMTAECEMAPLDAQMERHLHALRELLELVEQIAGPNTLRAIRADKPQPIAGLTALVGACQDETGSLGMALRGIAQRIGRL